MATYTVATTSDVVDPSDGVLSLREALTLADGDTTTADTIVFDGSVQGGTIVLAGSQLTVNSDVTIDGGRGVTIDAGGRSRVLEAEAGAALAHLTVTGGHATGEFDQEGGGIFAGLITTLALDHVTVTGNRAEGFGGGIFGDMVTLTDSTVSGNSADAAGGIGGGGFRGGSLVTLVDSTVSGNSAGDDGGGIIGQSISLVDSTVAGNSAGGDGGGILARPSPLGFYGAVSLSSSTVAGNTAGGDGGGIAARPFPDGGLEVTAALANSIVAGNDAAGPATDVLGAITASNSHNIFGSDVAGNTPLDLENVPAGLLFAGGLADNGGPTQTLALRDTADNPALGGADPAGAPAADQRGVERPLPDGTAPDVGAVEVDRFSGYEYLASYPDLEAAFGLNPAAAESHYLTTGQFEGRTILFDGLEYVASWSDLSAALGADDDAGARHYLEFGRAEGRATTFDGLQYIASYGDLVVAFGANRDAGSDHYIGHGASEERAPDAFDAAQYLANYADLREAFGDDQEAATVHYIAHGYLEGRTDAALAAAADFLS